MKEKLFLIVGLCFYIAAIISFFAIADDKAIFIGAFGIIGTAFIVIYNTKKKKKKSPNSEYPAPPRFAQKD